MKHVLCFGDSNTWGWDVETHDPKTGLVQRIPYALRWPGFAQTLLGPGYRLLENALNSRTIMHDDPYNPRRIGSASLEEAVEANAPLDAIVVALGVNELKHMFNLSAGMIARGMEKLVLTAKRAWYGYPAPKVLVVSPAPVRPDIERLAFGFIFGPLAHAKSLELAAAYREVAERHGCGYLDGASLGLILNDVDGLHYNREDHAKLGKAVAEAIKELLA